MKPRMACSNSRVLRWTPRGCASTRSTAASLKRRGVPGRGSSSSPSRRRRTKRCRHLPTVASATCTLRATSVLLWPAALSSTMRARNASACAVLGRRVQSNCCLSEWDRDIGESGRPRAMQFLLLISDAGRAVTYCTNIRLSTLERCKLWQNLPDSRTWHLELLEGIEMLDDLKAWL